MEVARIKSYLANLDFPYDLEKLPAAANLVGGSVRDALLQRAKTPLDLDIVLPEKAIATARQIANRYRAGFVVLDEKREIARVVFPQGTLDLARQEGQSLAADLQRRDFTINAIAYNIRSAELIDPLGGLPDLQQGVLRMVAPQNLTEDPIRLLRAYRQAAQLGLTLEEKTRLAIVKRIELLQTVAAERIRTELDYIFVAPEGNKWLAAAIADGLLDFWLPNARKIDQRSEQAPSSYGGVISDPSQLAATTKGISFCQQAGLQQPELTILAKLATLVSADSTNAETELNRLKYARTQIKAITKTVEYLPQLQQMNEPMSLREQYFWFLAVKDIFPLLVARAIATGVPQAIIVPLVQRYQDPTDQIAHPCCLVTGNDLIRELKLKPSPIIGRLLTEIQIARIESKIATPQQAIDYASSLLQTAKINPN